MKTDKINGVMKNKTKYNYCESFEKKKTMPPIIEIAGNRKC